MSARSYYRNLLESRFNATGAHDNLELSSMYTQLLNIRLLM
jgi:hypothetical protein